MLEALRTGIIKRDLTYEEEENKFLKEESEREM